MATFNSLVNKAQTLTEELTEDTPRFLKHDKLLQNTLFLYSLKEKSLKQRRRNSNADLVILKAGTLQGPEKPKKWTMPEFSKEARKADVDVPRFFKELKITAIRGGREIGSEIVTLFEVKSLGNTWYCYAESEQGINEVNCVREDKANLLARTEQ
jgi:hypothetical protein